MKGVFRAAAHDGGKQIDATDVHGRTQTRQRAPCPLRAFQQTPGARHGQWSERRRPEDSGPEIGTDEARTRRISTARGGRPEEREATDGRARPAAALGGDLLSRRSDEDRGHRRPAEVAAADCCEGRRPRGLGNGGEDAGVALAALRTDEDGRGGRVRARGAPPGDGGELQEGRVRRSGRGSGRGGAMAAGEPVEGRGGARGMARTAGAARPGETKERRWRCATGTAGTGLERRGEGEGAARGCGGGRRRGREDGGRSAAARA